MKQSERVSREQAKAWREWAESEAGPIRRAVPALASAYLEALALLEEVASMPVHIGGDFGERVREFLG